MNLNLSGKRVIVTGASKGIGLAITRSLLAEGCTVHMVARSNDVLRDLTSQLNESAQGRITYSALDLSKSENIPILLDASGPIDILVNNAGGPPPGDFRDWTRDTWIAALDANMLSAFALIQAVIDPMIDQKFGRIVNITSGSVKTPIPALGLSNGARAALTGFCGGLARQVAQHNVTVNGLLPGQYNTDRIETIIANTAKNENMSLAAARDMLEKRNPTRRLGEIHEFGFACAWMCSAHSGYLTGQNILIDGGSFNSTL